MGHPVWSDCSVSRYRYCKGTVYMYVKSDRRVWQQTGTSVLTVQCTTVQCTNGVHVNLAYWYTLVHIFYPAKHVLTKQYFRINTEYSKYSVQSVHCPMCNSVIYYKDSVKIKVCHFIIWCGAFPLDSRHLSVSILKKFPAPPPIRCATR